MVQNKMFYCLMLNVSFTKKDAVDRAMNGSHNELYFLLSVQERQESDVCSR